MLRILSNGWCLQNLTPLYERVLSTRVHCRTQFGHWAFEHLSHFLSILGDPKNYGCINPYGFKEPLWTLEDKESQGRLYPLSRNLPLWSPEAKEQWRTTKHVQLHTMFFEKITPYFQISYLLHLLSILNEHFQITEFLNMCVMQHWPLIPCILLSIEQSNTYDASSGALHTSQLQKERINV